MMRAGNPPSPTGLAGARFVACLVIALLPAGAMAASAKLVLAPGQSGTFAIPVHNISSSSTTLVLQGSYFGPAPVHSEYVFLPANDARCAIPQLGNGRSRVVVGALAAGETLECRWPVTRSAGSRNDLAFGICTDLASTEYCGEFAHIGWVPDVSLTTHPVGVAREGDTEVTVRVSARNRSDTATAARRIQTECAEFSAPATGAVPFDVANDFAGACPTAPLENGCMNFTGTLFERREFFIGPILAGQETSCLLKLRLRAPLTRDVSLALHFEDFRTPLAEGGIAYDAEASNDSTRIGAAVGGGPAAPFTLPVGGPATWLLGIGMAFAAMGRLRRRPAA